MIGWYGMPTDPRRRSPLSRSVRSAVGILLASVGPTLPKQREIAER
jgi:hypothetical protein